MMKRESSPLVLGVAAMACMLAVPAWVQAQSGAAEPPPNSSSAARTPEDVMMGLDRILDQIARNLTIRYNLNEKQSEFTREMLHTRVKKFLQDHQKEAWPVLRELMQYQMNGETPPADSAKRIAAAAIPLYEEAKKAIRDGNEAWRQQLSDQQKTLHDYDLRLMEEQFKEVGGNLKNWDEGQPSSGSLFPAPPKKSDPNQPPTPPKPPADKLGPSVEPGTSTDRYTAFVDEFIKTCQLDAGQTTTARSILQEILTKRDTYKKQHQAEGDKLEADMRKALLDGDRTRQAELEEAEKKLWEPLQAFFDEMVNRLVGQLRAEQKEIYNRTLGANRATPAPGKSQPSPTPASKPDAGQPAPAKPEAGKPEATSGAAPAGQSAPPADDAAKDQGKAGKKKKKG